jgi:sugar phosphate isomerase/epimerase
VRVVVEAFRGVGDADPLEHRDRALAQRPLGDPLAAVRALGQSIYWVHAKDTWIEPATAGPHGVLDTKPANDAVNRSWRYVTLGYGHGEQWWRLFASALRMAGYDGVLSIEHEDVALPPLDGVRQTVSLLRSIV